MIRSYEIIDPTQGWMQKDVTLANVASRSGLN